MKKHKLVAIPDYGADVVALQWQQWIDHPVTQMVLNYLYIKQQESYQEMERKDNTPYSAGFIGGSLATRNDVLLGAQNVKWVVSEYMQQLKEQKGLL